MAVNIYPVTLGFNQTYIIKGDGVIMIDGGSPKKSKIFIEGLKKISIKPEEIKLLILTHGHWDHIGSAKIIKEISGAKIAMHWREKELPEKALKSIPSGITLWGKILIKFMALFMPFVHVPSFNVDIVLKDEEFSLLDFGIPGRIIPTPGHSSGSVSIVLETGDAFVGDLAMNAIPLRRSPGLPIFAEDLQMVKNSWKLLIHNGVKQVYPAHGKPFPVKIIQDIL
jgi:glyoxylase-like metal-dependent hydrolase (beta-lactamase superfamily II)